MVQRFDLHHFRTRSIEERLVYVNPPVMLCVLVDHTTLVLLQVAIDQDAGALPTVQPEYNKVLVRGPVDSAQDVVDANDVNWSWYDPGFRGGVVQFDDAETDFRVDATCLTQRILLSQTSINNVTKEFFGRSYRLLLLPRFTLYLSFFSLTPLFSPSHSLSFSLFLSLPFAETLLIGNCRESTNLWILERYQLRILVGNVRCVPIVRVDSRFYKRIVKRRYCQICAAGRKPHRLCCIEHLLCKKHNVYTYA